jgi:hypothetical protein
MTNLNREAGLGSPVRLHHVHDMRRAVYVTVPFKVYYKPIETGFLFFLFAFCF